MTTPNLDATQNCWVESLARFTFSIEYQKGWDNAVTHALNQVTLKLDTETVKSIWDGVTMETIGRVDAHDPVVAESDEEVHNQVWETAVLARAVHACVNLYVDDWVATQQEDSILKTVIKWICWEMMWALGRERPSFESRKNDALPRGPLPSPHTGWWVRRGFAVHGPHSSLKCCHEWMSPKCWTPGSAVNFVPNTRPVLVAQYGHTGAEGH